MNTAYATCVLNVPAEQGSIPVVQAPAQCLLECPLDSGYEIDPASSLLALCKAIGSEF